MKHKLEAPPEYWSLTDAAKKEICNGCGAKGKKDFIPDSMWLLDISEACNIHDYMYHVAEPLLSHKTAADDIFLKNLNLIIDTGSWALRWLRKRRAFKYYLAVHYFADDAFYRDKK